MERVELTTTKTTTWYSTIELHLPKIRTTKTKFYLLILIKIICIESIIYLRSRQINAAPIRLPAPPVYSTTADAETEDAETEDAEDRHL